MENGVGLKQFSILEEKIEFYIGDALNIVLTNKYYFNDFNAIYVIKIQKCLCKRLALKTIQMLFYIYYNSIFYVSYVKTLKSISLRVTFINNSKSHIRVFILISAICI